MREIKFRGKHKSPYGDKWVHGYYALEDGEHVIIMPHSTSYEKALKENRPIPPISAKHTIDFNTIGEYIELKDKNGNEIYEGDILRQVDLIRVVKKEMSCGSCCSQVIGFGASGKGHLDFIDFSRIDTIEIIGNIYDNPDLLKEG